MNIFITFFASLFLFICSSHGAETLTFPKDFQWCVATAGHQVEGDNIYSDWWEWEQRQGTIANGDTSGKAAFHMDRLAEDVKLMKSLGVKTYRYSIEWSRIEPRQGVFDPAAIAYYHKELALLKKAGIKPFVTIHHFVQPLWFTRTGGWKREDSSDIFLNYVQKIEAEFGKEVSMWVTFNEPNVYLIGAYGIGATPPGDKDWQLWIPTVNIMKAHAKAYHFLHQQAKSRNQTIQVGMAYHFRPVIAASFLFKKSVEVVNHYLNWSLPLAAKTGELKGLNKSNWGPFHFPTFESIDIPELKGTQDFIGVNYYTEELIVVNFRPPYVVREPMPGLVASELNWGIDVKGFGEVLKQAHEYFPDLPFIVSENGLADSQDVWRKDFIVKHLQQLHKSMTELPHKIDGYCHWTLMDNFEWQEGYAPKFGLYTMDRMKKGERSPRPSAELVRKIYTTNKLEIE